MRPIEDAGGTKKAHRITRTMTSDDAAPFDARGERKARRYIKT